MARRVPVLAALLAFAVGAAAGEAGFKKPYFGATKPGSFAKLKSTDDKGAVTEYTYARLPDQKGEAWLETGMAIVSGQFKGTSSVTSCLMPAAFPLESDAIDFQGHARRCVASTGGGQPIEYPASTIKAILDGGTNYAKLVSFKGTETVDGRTADHYTYADATNFMNVPAHTTGDLWVSEAVPFGVVREVMTTRDKAGKVLTKSEIVLVATGQDARSAMKGWSWDAKSRARTRKR